MLPVGFKAVVPAAALCGIYCLWRKRRNEGKVSGSSPALWWALPFLLCALSGAVRLETDMQDEDRYERIAEEAEKLAEQAKQSGGNGLIRAEGTISDMKGGNGETYAAVMQLDHVSLYIQGRAAGYGDLLIYLEDEPDRFQVRPGMTVSVWGELETMGRATNPGQFDYRTYYHALGIEGRMFADKADIVESVYSPYLYGILKLKEWAGDMLDRLCDSHDKGLFQAVILGDRTDLDDDVYNLYRKNGIAHLLAVSGLHVSLLGLGLYRLIRRMGAGFEVSGVLAAAFTVSYGVMTGSSGSVVRAVLMVCLQLLADKLGRTYDLLTAAAVAAVLLLVQSPSLLFQAGFQLSFGAMLAVGAVLPVLENWLPGSRLWAAGLAIQIVTFPMIVYHFFEYPIYGFFLNLLVLPLMGYVLMSGIAGLFLGALWVPAGSFAIGTGHYILLLYEWLCRAAQRLPGAIQIMGRPSFWQIGGYMAVWTGILVLANGERLRTENESETEEPETAGVVIKPVFRYLICAAGLLLGFLLLRPIPPSGLTASYLDVGQGDGICLETEDLVILIDGGSTSNKMLGEQVLEPFLKYSGISQIDYAVISHGDEDHISGIRYLLESDHGIRIDTLIMPWLGKEKETYEELERLAEQAGAKTVWMKAGGQIAGDLTLRCLYAGDENYRDDTNDHSLVLEAVYGRTRMLLCGDMSSEGEKRWLQEIRPPASGEEEKALPLSGPVQVLKVAHHGSNYSTCREFLEYADPDWAVISCGKQNRYGHPGADTMERLREQNVKSFLTMSNGAVIITTDGKEMRAKTMLGDGKAAD